MLRDSQGKRLWIADGNGDFVEVRKPSDIHARPRGMGTPDWWVVAREDDWLPPGSAAGQPASLLGREQGGEAQGGAAGMKIGAGHKPQGYDARGRYTGPRGGAVNLSTGEVRLYENAEGQEGGEPDGNSGDEANREPGRDSGREPELTDILLADSGRVATDAGSLSNEDRRLEEKRFTPERLVKNAQADLGSDEWAPQRVGGKDINKCNIFVAAKLRESGAHVPNIGGFSGMAGENASDTLNEMTGGSFGGNVPSASDWHTGKVTGFERVAGAPMPGDVASDGKHVAIVSGPEKTVSASSGTKRVVENDWGFRPDQKSTSFWRYRGN